MRFNKICITGAPCVGKSTITTKLKEIYKINSIHPQFNQTLHQFFPNQNFTNLNSQEIEMIAYNSILNRIKLENKDKTYISEGGIIYDFAWILHFTNNIIKTKINLTQIENLIIQNIKNYELIIYIPIEFEFIQRNKPFESKQTQTQINNYITKILKQHKIKYITLSGNQDQRIKAINQILN